MKLLKNQKIELCASQDETKRILTFVNIVKEDRTGKFPGKSCIEAVDGMKLVVIPCKLDKDDVVGLLKAKQLSKIRSTSKQVADSIFITLKKKCIRIIDKLMKNVVIERELDDAVFPNIAAVIPKEKAKMQITLNAYALADMQDAFGSCGVTIKINNELGPLEIVPAHSDCEAYGVLMPMRRKD